MQQEVIVFASVELACKAAVKAIIDSLAGGDGRVGWASFNTIVRKEAREDLVSQDVALTDLVL